MAPFLVPLLLTTVLVKLHARYVQRIPNGFDPGYPDSALIQPPSICAILSENCLCIIGRASLSHPGWNPYSTSTSSLLISNAHNGHLTDEVQITKLANKFKGKTETVE